MRPETATFFYQRMKISQAFAVSINREIWNRPNDLTQEVDHGTDVVKDHRHGFFSRIKNFEPHTSRSNDRHVHSLLIRNRLRSQEEVGEFSVGACANLLREIDTIGF